MVDHSTIMFFPLLFFVLVSGMVEEKMRNSESSFDKISPIVSARSENFTREQMSSLNQTISKLNENGQRTRIGRLQKSGLDIFQNVTMILKEKFPGVQIEDIIGCGALKPDWTWTIWIVIAVSLFTTF